MTVHTKIETRRYTSELYIYRCSKQQPCMSNYIQGGLLPYKGYVNSIMLLILENVYELNPIIKKLNPIRTLQIPSMQEKRKLRIDPMVRHGDISNNTVLY
ncbi:hypothetical protein CEXT_248581 [Caerostris extrusa]|uniref:Uncharacterized protein n=1 Tax=Caerostris extrusa TaxID=172846 RepID=A0AAV4SKM5_CAEEX|nr:hypothetical protein CEXT_248581 [Caerostris extrusa]